MTKITQPINFKFYGREAELKLLESYYSQQESRLITIYGRRRIGKSALIEEFSKNKVLYKFMGLPPDKNISATDQRASFAKTLSSYGLPEIKTEDWSDLFKLLALKIEGKQAVIVFDEISWMALEDPTFLPKLKSDWDECFKNKSQVLLILCGSVSSWIQKNILSSTGFVGRIDHVIELKPLGLKDCNAFWKDREITPYEKLKVLCVTGGVPLYINAFDLSQPFEKNIERLCLTPGGLLLREFDVIFNDLFDKRAGLYKKIVESLISGPKDTRQIAESIQWEPSGVLTDYLNDLVTAGFISRDFLWDFQSGELGKLSRYRLSDNYLRFYLRCLQPHKEKIEQRGLNTPFLSLLDLPSWPSILGLQLENLVLQNRELIWESLGYSARDIVSDNPFFQKKNTQQAGCQIDYLIQTRHHNLIICEIKFSKNLISSEIIQEVKNKIKNLKHPKSFSCFPVLIHANEVQESVRDSQIFMKIINLGDFLN